mgnify:CR=1 FL=1
MEEETVQAKKNQRVYVYIYMCQMRNDVLLSVSVVVIWPLNQAEAYIYIPFHSPWMRVQLNRTRVYSADLLYSIKMMHRPDFSRIKE